MSENMKIWLKKLYLEAAEDHRIAGSNEHLWAIGSDTEEATLLHEMNADEHRAFAEMLEEMANQVT